ncbi:unnamed protein product [Rodentolepis nana]|uniref:Elongation of very long chain fatty acids protein n=1 Tax=Rodentolepis nana TaxID=102285 RepID=A0A0R3TH52_RODNA|nr:unnamed protein product [Rodentolepis nana]
MIWYYGPPLRKTLRRAMVFAYFMQMIWYYGIPGLLYADDLVLWYSAYFTQMIWYYGIPPPRKKAKERTESVLNCALT